MNRKKYYVSVASGEISQIKYGNNADFTIHATDGEVRMLREKFNNMHEADMGTYWRSHYPIVPYHKDSDNDEYDREIAKAFQMIYDLGDAKTKENITTMAVIEDDHSR